jgi:hypothetical protein
MILSVVIFFLDLWNFYLSIPILIKFQNISGMLQTIMYPGVFSLILLIFYVIGYFKNQYWVTIVTLIFSIQQLWIILPLYSLIGNGIAGSLYWSSILSVNFELFFYEVNLVVVIMMGLYKILSKKQT